jgi:hypothetical protein
MDKSKGIGKVYLEGKIIGEELLALKKSAKKVGKLYSKYNDFNYKDNAQYIQDFLTPTFEEELKEGIKKYGHVQDTLDHSGIENHNVAAIFEEIDGS